MRNLTTLEFRREDINAAYQETKLTNLWAFVQNYTSNVKGFLIYPELAPKAEHKRYC